MTALLLDLGNTRWKAAYAADATIGEVCHGDYGRPAALTEWVRGNAEGLDALWVSSVVDEERTHALLGPVETLLNLSARRVRSTDPMPGLVSGYRKPAQLGIDRLLAMVAARARFTGPLCVVDAGSAVTIDFVTSAGQHIGGFILPGSRMFRDCLLANTSIPRDADTEPGAVLGRDTATSVALGGLNAAAGIVERFTTGSAALFPAERPVVVVGGGDAGQLVPLIPLDCTTLHHLVLRGLFVLAKGERQ